MYISYNSEITITNLWHTYKTSNTFYKYIICWLWRFLLLSKKIAVKSHKRASCHLVVNNKRGDNKKSRLSGSLKVFIHRLVKLILEVKPIKRITSTYVNIRKETHRFMAWSVSSCAYTYCVWKQRNMTLKKKCVHLFALSLTAPQALCVL